MIAIVAKHFIKEENIREAIRIAKEMVTETIANDRGCLRYELFIDRNNPNVIAFLEEWEDIEAIEAHKTKDHFTPRLAFLVEHAEKQRDVTQYIKA